VLPIQNWWDDNDGYNYESDNAEALVYPISHSGKLKNTALYVMKRCEAVRFCERKETACNNGINSWAYCFTTHRRAWRDELDTFRKDDGRFDKLLKEMGIQPIYRGGDILTYEDNKKIMKSESKTVKQAKDMFQLDMFSIVSSKA